MTKKWLSAILILAIWVPFSLAKKKDNEPGGEYFVVAPEFTSAPKIDGKLDDEFWTNAVMIDKFTQYEPREGSEPSEKTVAYLGFDRNNLYIAVKAFDSNPNAIRACLVQRDKVYGDDEITIYLDTFNTKERAYAFKVNPCGVQTDGIYQEVRRRHRGGGFDRIDRNWDTYFHTAASIDDEGYSVEISIPFKSIRFPDTDSQTWGLQIQRSIRRKNEDIYWRPRSRDVNGFLIQAGQMQIDGNLAKGKNFEVMPVATGLKEDTGKLEPELGLNLKYGITSNITTDLTINPDYSQIEADMPQIDVNQRFALYYAEKRPFFLEGKDYFDTPIELVYTRTIADPTWGAKVTGKIGKTTFGVLSSYDTAPMEFETPENGDGESEVYEYPRNFVNLLRMKFDLYPESYIGAIYTDKRAGDNWQSITSASNQVGGVDGNLKFLRFNRFSFQIVGSQSKTNTYDSGIVPAMIFNLSHASRRWSFSAGYTHLPPDFDASVGYIRRVDIKQFQSRLGYNILPMNDYIVDIRPSIEYRRAYDFNNVLTDEEVRLGGFLTGWRNSFIYGGYSWELERYQGIDFKREGLRVHINSEPLGWLSGGINFSFGDSIYYSENPYLGWKISYGGNLLLRPLTNLRLFYNYRNDTFWRDKGGERVYRINIISQRINFQISRHLSLRLITDYNDYYQELFNSFLISYELNPGTVFYLGVDDERGKDVNGRYEKLGRFYYIKFSYWWRI